MLILKIKEFNHSELINGVLNLTNKPIQNT